jgi:CheY-like chemotaxis protein
LGIRVDWAKDTEEALRKLARKGYDLVISDMGRPSGDRAGYDLLRRVRAGGETIPYIIYAGSNLPEDKAQAKDLGAQGNTNDPQELFELVIDHLLR